MLPHKINIASEIKGRMRQGLFILIDRYPFHAALVASWHLQEDATIATVSVGEHSNCLMLYYNPAYIASITLEQVVGVLHHEINHVLFGHLTLDETIYSNREALTIAMEVTANEFVKEPLPGTPILLKDFPCLPKDESTLKRYKRLENLISKDMADSLKKRVGHGRWHEVKGDANLIKLLIENDIVNAAKSVSPEVMKSLPKEIQERIQSLLDNDGIGNSTTGISENIGCGNGKLNWKQILRRILAREIDCVFRTYRPPRRFPHLVGLVPTRTWCGVKLHVMAVIDTSGSISNKLLCEINGELKRLAQNTEVTVVECDMAIQNVYKYRPIKYVSGRGGTSFIPPFRKKFLGTVKPDVVVYFTDGQGKAPGKSPKIPVIWCLCPHGVMPAKWGRKIIMHG